MAYFYLRFCLMLTAITASFACKPVEGSVGGSNARPMKKIVGRKSPANIPSRIRNLVPKPDIAVEVISPGCNASAFSQLPEDTSLFLGRMLITSKGKLAGLTGPNDCSGADVQNDKLGEPYNRWGLVLNRFDWKTRSFTAMHAVLDTSLNGRTGLSKAVIGGGADKGAVIRSAYDPDILVYRGRYIVAFECTLDNGSLYAVTGTSSCIGRYDPVTRAMDMNQIDIVVSGYHRDDIDYAASVPRLLVFKDDLYLYWSALTIRNGAFVTASERAVKLAMTPTGVRPIVSGTQRLHAIDPRSVEVWSVASDAMSDTLVNVLGLKSEGQSFLVFGAMGGGGCVTPAGRSPGCFRLTVMRADKPLRPHGLNEAKPAATGLPTNPQEYTVPITDPQGRTWLLGHYVRPPLNGFSEQRPVPSKAFWRHHQVESVLAMYPLE